MSFENTAISEVMHSAFLSDPSEWVDRHGDYLYRCALLRLRDPKIAEDIVQETFLSAFESKHRYAGHASERSWLLGILKHKVVDPFRKTQREKPVEYVDRFEIDNEGVFDEAGHWKRDETGPAAWQADPDVLFEQKAFWTSLESCLSKLPERMANAFTLREIDGFESAEVCAALEMTASNLWVLLHRARMRLRQAKR